MAHLDVDLTFPIALLVASIAGVMIVRALVGHGRSRAAARTRRLLARHGLAPRPGGGGTANG